MPTKTVLSIAAAAALVLSATSVAFAADTPSMADTSIYRIGYPVEVSITGTELGNGPVAANAVAVKHYAMGRLAWELAYVMPDGRTVYAGDDGTNRGMFRFVADRSGDLSSGTLYAAKLIQTTAAGDKKGGQFDIKWLNMGHSSNSDIDQYIQRGVQFSDLFDAQEPSKKHECAAGYMPSEADGNSECLKLKTSNKLGMSALEIRTAASRLETLRFGAYLGATTEFRKFEGITYDANRKQLYIAISQISKAMTKGPKLAGIDDDINVAANDCGGVYKLAVDNNMTTTHMQALVLGKPKTYTGEWAANTCDLDGIASPDNVVMGPNNDTLIIGEDTDAHQNDVLWAYNLKTNKLTRIFSTPYGSETTSPWIYKNINNDFDYMITVVQHPYGESDEKMARSDDEKRAYIGYTKLPKIKAKDQVAFENMLPASTDEQRRLAHFTPSVRVNGKKTALQYQTLFRSGDKVGAATFGQHIDVDGNPMTAYSKADLPNGISTSPDHTTLLKHQGALFSITQFEEGAGMMYISKLQQDGVGDLIPMDSKPVDLSGVYGGYTFCAGMPTAWGTHLGGEEYPVDANAFEKAGGTNKYFSPYLEYFAK
jgi:secreted PhoX family phosphatase